MYIHIYVDIIHECMHIPAISCILVRLAKGFSPIQIERPDRTYVDGCY